MTLKKWSSEDLWSMNKKPSHWSSITANRTSSSHLSQNEASMTTSKYSVESLNDWLIWILTSDSLNFLLLFLNKFHSICELAIAFFDILSRNLSFREVSTLRSTSSDRSLDLGIITYPYRLFKAGNTTFDEWCFIIFISRIVIGDFLLMRLLFSSLGDMDLLFLSILGS